jgi:DNA-binding IclR family transcriptional regulator
MYIAKVDGPKSVRVNTPVGLISPSWCTATGRTMLADRRDCWGRVLAGPLRKLTPNTVTDAKQIRAILEKVGGDGYAVARGERNIENGGIASPIRDHTGDVVAACGLALPVFRMNKLLINRSIPMVMETAVAISRALGYAPGRAARAPLGTHG